MPIYEYLCPVCGWKIEKFVHKIRGCSYITCKCGARMKKIISLPNTDLKNNVRFSSSMGVNPKRIPEAERLYPGSEYDPKGRLIIHNRKEKLERMKQRRLVEFQ